MTPILAFFGLDDAAMYMVIQFAIMIGSAVLAMVLRPKTKTSEPQQPYGWQPQTTQREGVPYELVFGTCPVQGNAFGPWTEAVNTVRYNDNAWQVIFFWLSTVGTLNPLDNPIVTSSRHLLHLRLQFGDGPVLGFRTAYHQLNGKAPTDWTGLTVTERKGTDLQTASTLANRTELTRNDVLTEGQSITITMPDSDYIGLSLMLGCTDGLASLSQQGDLGINYLYCKIEIREVGGAWHTCFDHALIGQTMNPIRWLFTADSTYPKWIPYTVAQGLQHEWRVTCTKAAASDLADRGTLTVLGVQEIYSSTYRDPGLVELELAAIAADSLSGDIQYTGILDGKICESLDGESFAFTKDPALIQKALWCRPVICGDGSTVPYYVDYYRGYDPQYLNAEEFAAASAWLSAPVPDGRGLTEARYEFSGRFADQAEAWSQAMKVAASCRCIPWFDGRKIRLYIDKSTPAARIFCDANMLADSYSEEAVDSRSRPSAITATIFNEAANWASQQVQATDELATKDRVLQIDGFGCTRVSQHCRTAKYLFARSTYLDLTNAWQTGPCGMDAEKGMVCYLQSDRNGRAIGGSVVSAPASKTVVVNKTLTMTSGVEYRLILQTIENTGIEVVDYEVDHLVGTSTIVLKTALTYTPVARDVFIFGRADQIDQFRITAVKPDGTGNFGFTGERYTENYYTHDDEDPYLDVALNVTPIETVKRSLPQLTRAELMASYPPDQVLSSGNSDAVLTTDLLFTGDGVSKVTWTIAAGQTFGWVRYRGQTYPIQNTGGPVLDTSGALLLDTEDAALVDLSLGSTEKEYVYFDPHAADPTRLYATDDRSADLDGQERFVLCYNKNGTAYPQPGLRLGKNATLIGVEEGATVGATWGVNVDGSNKPDDNADVTAAHAESIIYRQTTAPSTPQAGWIWYDTSASPTIVRRYNGSTWDTCGVDLMIWQNGVDPTKLDGNAIAPQSVATGALAVNSVTAMNIMVAALSAITAVLGDVVAGSLTGTTITGGLIRTATSGRYIQMDADGIRFFMQGTVGIFGTTAGGGGNLTYGTTVGGGSNAIYGAGLLARLYNVNSGIPFDVVCEQTSVGDIHLINRASDPTTGKSGDLALVNNQLRVCISNTPTWQDAN